MSQKNRFINPRGFTIPELLVSSIIMTFVFTATVISYIMLDSMWKDDLTLSELARETTIAVEKVTRGTQANGGLQAAKGIVLPLGGASADRVDYKDMNDVSQTFYLSNAKIYTGAGSSILSNVQSAAFSNNTNDTIAIDIVASKHVVNRDIAFHLQTSVKPRN